MVVAVAEPAFEGFHAAFVEGDGEEVVGIGFVADQSVVDAAFGFEDVGGIGLVSGGGQYLEFLASVTKLLSGVDEGGDFVGVVLEGGLIHG